MILGVGLDIVNIDRIHSSLEKFGDKFKSRIFTKLEIAHCKNFQDNHSKSRYFAKRFAAKEAFSKAIGLGIGRGINFIDIEIINNKLGKPEISLQNNSISFLKKHFQNLDFKIDLSISDEKTIAQAIVIISRN